MATVFAPHKALEVVEESWDGVPARGYVIHHGRLEVSERLERVPGGGRRGAVMGTMWHGLLECDDVRRRLLQDVARAVGRTGFAPDASLDFAAERLRRLDVLADLVEEYVGLNPLLELIEHGPPSGLPDVPAGPR